MKISHLARSLVAVAAVGLATACGSSENPACLPTDPGCNAGGGGGGGTSLSVSQVTPANGASDVETNTDVTITFSAAVDAATVSATSVSLGAVTGALTVAGSVVTFTPDAVLANGTAHTVTVNGVAASDGTAMDAPFTASFTTRSVLVTAMAGADRDVSAGGAVTLDGSASSGSSVTWTQLSGPDVGSLNGDSPSFTAPDEIGVLAFEVSATDGSTTDTDTLSIWVLEDANQAFWVAEGGSPSNPGTREAPLSLIQDAINIADNAGNGADVYVAAGMYAESLTLRSRVSVYGGFDPADWSRDIAANRPVVTGGETAVFGESANNITVEGLEIVATDAANPGGSSIGLFLAESDGVTIRHNVIAAGMGLAGANGSLGSPYGGRAADDGNNGADAGFCPNNGGSGGSGSGGGNGGAGANGGFYGGFSGTSASGSSGPYGGGGSAGGNGEPGRPGSTGSHGARGEAFGTLSSTGYATADGRNGGSGSIGLGGGGGGSGGGNGTTSCGGGGGGGGEGGGGGGGGTGGDGGGASLGVVLFGQTVATVESNQITTADGGNGGNGGNGRGGQSPGDGGNGGDDGFLLGDGGNGGDGGRGGTGGAGAGGGGGPTIGILEDAGASLSQSNNTITLGTPGAGGSPGTNGNAGVDGESADHKKIS